VARFAASKAHAVGSGFAMSAAGPAVFIGLGSNVGDRERALSQARARLREAGFAETTKSALYLTEPVGGPPQDWFLNQVIGGATALAPEDLMRACLDAERALGRERTVRNGPRTLDVDLLLYGDVVREGAALVLPHPRLHERRFVLVPLVEIAPHARHPVLGATARELLDRCADRAEVGLFQRAPAER
jgi:2-amino-4-hydroxy-6-hydroxymethyldihydropteridine diphosphokinase